MAKIKQIYEANKSAKIGSNCICPSCGTEFAKESYQQAFCKTKKGTKCKDKYWNTVTPTKRNNTTRISPASSRWQSINKNHLYYTTSNIIGYSQFELDKIDREENELNFEGGGEGGNVYVERCEYCGCLNCRCEDF